MFHVKHSGYGPEDFQRAQVVSRETLARFETYAGSGDLNKDHQPVSPATIPRSLVPAFPGLRPAPPFTQEIPTLWTSEPRRLPWSDSGHSRTAEVHLVESDQKKVAFSERRPAQPRPSHLPRPRRSPEVHPSVQICGPGRRPHRRLLELAAPITLPETKFVFLKGQNVGRNDRGTQNMENGGGITRQPTDSTGRVVIWREYRHVAPRSHAGQT